MRWKPIPGYEDMYEVSSSGKIRSVERRVRKGNGTRRVAPRRRKLSTNTKGYLSVGLSKQGTSKTHEVHKLVMLAFRGPPSPGLEVCHKNGIRTDCRLKNLRYGTRASNHADKKRHGTSSIGEKHGGHKLSESNVESLLKLYISGKHSQKELAQKFGVSQSMISLIVRDENWTHLEKNEEALRQARSRSPLTEENVRSIRQEYSRGLVTYNNLANKYGVAATTISGIVNRHRWIHV